MVEEEVLETSPILKTGELIIEGRNEDPVTGYPFEVPELRRRLIDVLGEAVQKKETVVFFDGDIDNLKGLNDLCGKKKANEGIKQTVREKEKAFLGQEGARAIYIYRPQAGGDELKGLVILEGSEKGLSEEVEGKLREPSNFVYEEETLIKIHYSLGVSSRRLTGAENARSLLQEMEQESGESLAIEKAKKLIETIRETVGKGRELNPEEYIEEISRIWGSRRMTPGAFKVILSHLVAKTEARLLKES